MTEPKSPTLALMEEAGMEPTRDNFLHASFYGKQPGALHPEEEAELPEPFQKGFREMSEKLHETAGKKKEKAAKAKEKAEK